MAEIVADFNKDFDKLVAHYGEVDNQIKTLTKELESDKVTIKNVLGATNRDDYESGGYKVIRQVSYRTKVDEDKMLKVLKKDWQNRYGEQDCPYIKTKEYVDMEQLESVLYANELPKDVLAELNDCQDKTEVVALKCMKVKKGE